MFYVCNVRGRKWGKGEESEIGIFICDRDEECGGGGCREIG